VTVAKKRKAAPKEAEDKKSKLYSFSIDPELHDELMRFAKDRGEAMADHVRWAIRRHIKFPPASPGDQPLDPNDGVAMPPRAPHPRDQE